MFTLIQSDLEFILKQIELAEAHAAGGDLRTLVGEPASPLGLRTVDGSFNNLTNPAFGAADQVFPRMTTPVFRDAAEGTSFSQVQGDVTDPEPRLISNLISDETAANPASAAAASDAPFNSLFTFFGQFFDHGLDLVTKGGSGTVFVPLQPDDPLFQPGAPTNFMVLSRATNQLGPDGELGTADDVQEHLNQTTSFVDQNQTYTSHPSHQVFLREYTLDAEGKPVATGRLLDGADGGLANWAEVKAQARTLLGIELSDENATDVPLLATDPYGNFIPGPNGFPQLVIEGPDGEKGTGDETLLEGNPAAPVSTAGAVQAGHAFLDDLSQDGNPAGKIADTGDEMGLSNIDGSATEDTFDDEALNAHFATGDGRGNENIGLTAIHHVFHSEHNRMVGHIQEVIGASDDPEFIAQWQLDDGTWDGERLFQAARFATELQYQHLVFQEFARGRVQPEIDTFVSHDPQIDASIVAEFAHTVYRFGHTMLTDTVPRTAADGTQADIPLVEAFLNPLEFSASGATPEEAAGALVRGMAGQAGSAVDEFVTDAVRNDLLGLPLDLPALNIARGRDTGIPPLNEVRRQFHEATGGDERLEPYESWADFAGSLRHPESLVNFIAAYGTHATIVEAETMEAKRAAAASLVLGGSDAPADRVAFLESDAAASGLDDVDFWIGGLAEAPLGEGLLGPSFGYVFETQLENLQSGDRFYYPHRTAGLNFFNQLQESSFAELIMSNTDATGLPADVFAAPGTGNPAIWADDADNVLAGNEGNDAIMARGGNDTLTDPAGDDRLEGGEGNDRIDAVPGTDKVFGGAGDDFILAGGDTILAGMGNDIVFANDASTTIQGNEGDDWIEGGATDDLLSGDNHDPRQREIVEGHDVLAGGGGHDVLEGEHGDDIFLGGEDFDRFYGMGGTDWVSYELSDAGIEADLALAAGEFAAAASAAAPDSDLFEGVEALSGSAFDDFLQGDDAPLANELLGGAGSDRLEGRGGDDRLDGDAFLHVELSAETPGGTILRETLAAPAADDIDVALFSEAAENYDIIANADGSLTVTHARGGQGDGSDTLVNIEQLEFAGDVVPAGDFLLA